MALASVEAATASNLSTAAGMETSETSTEGLATPVAEGNLAPRGVAVMGLGS